MASSSSQSKYEVFLSFRGEDTRNGFTSHLAAALHRKQIQFFIDYEELKKGDEISPALSNAIETSDISIIIFSEDYASSKWCLNELVKILDCNKVNGQIVIPVFYQVDPSDVRKQCGSFGEAFVENEKNFPDKLQKWRAALTEASNFSGHHCNESSDEAELVEEIVEDISKKLEDMSGSTDFDGFVGLNSQIEEMKSLLCLELHDVRIMGIWGMGGIGKTTIASVVFHQISGDFQGKCFMANVREESNKMGVIRVRDEVISQLLGENLKIRTLTIPPNIRKRLQRMKVLIILDDVHDAFTQLESLAGRVDRFSPGSRIIITTRDKQVLDKCGVKILYEVKGLKHSQALEFFRRKAFRQNNCSHDLLELSKEVLHFADGNPLALEVLGSSLYQKSKQQWTDKLHNLKLISEPSIYKVLKVSYDELNSEEKEIFLDIACFFKGEDVDFVTRIQDDPTSIRYRLNILVDKSLITILNGYQLQMHDLLQEMGQTIVRQESVKEPGKRSRLWDHNDIYHVLKKNKGTDQIEGIFLDLSKINGIHLSSQAFAKMSNLRLLAFYMPECDGVPITSSKVLLEEGLEYLPEELRFLHWHEYPLETLPFDFEPENLIELNLPYSKIQQIWEAKKEALKIKYINLSYSRYLMRMPDLSEMPNLKRTNLLNCANLSSVTSSIQNFKHLTMLRFQGCKNLRSFPSNLHFVSPITIDFSYCVNITEFPQISGIITELDLSETAIEEVPSSIECLTNLERLYMIRCRRLKRVSTSICKLKSLTWLTVVDCLNLKNFAESLERMEHLNHIDAHGSTISQLPSSVADSNEPSSVIFSGCRGLVSLSVTLLFGLSPSYKLDLTDCGLTAIPQEIGGLSLLQWLLLSGNSFESLPTSIKKLSRLTGLYLSDCNMLQSIPELPLRLQILDANRCLRLQSLPEIPSCLEELDASLLEKLSKHFFQDEDDILSVGFWFCNCLKLDEEANDKNLADSQLRIQHMAIASFRLFYDLEDEECCILKGPTIILPGSKIPEWFSYQSLGSKITLQLPQHCCQNLIGFAFCAALVSFDWDRNGSDVDFGYSFAIWTLSGRKHFRHCHIKQGWLGGHHMTKTNHVVFGFIACGNVGFPYDNHRITAFFEFLSSLYKVRRCGVCPVYAIPKKTEPNIFNLNFATEIWKLDDMASTGGTSASQLDWNYDEEELYWSSD